MAEGYFTDAGVYTSQALPTPTDTPYRTPSFSRSRKTSGRGTPRSATSSSPPPLPSSDDIQKDENGEDLSPLDPKRFTSTLHASLVSEILSLRRELESKHGFIEKLETNYAVVKNENEALTEKLAGKDRESRAVKKQLKGLEDGTLSVIEELCRERDQSAIAHNELKKRHETMLKKYKTQEEQAEKTQSQFERDRRKWDNEKRQLERKVHVSDSRLRSLVKELQSHEQAGRELDDEGHALGNESETGSIRSLRAKTPTHTRQRSSSLNDLRDPFASAGGLTGVSLADELQSDDDEEDYSLAHEGQLHDEVTHAHNVYHSRKSSKHVNDDHVMAIVPTDDTPRIVHHSRKSSKYLNDDASNAFATFNGVPVPQGHDDEPKNFESAINGTRELLTDSTAVIHGRDHAGEEIRNGNLQEQVKFSPAYVDTGIQFTPPPSPLIPPQSVPLPDDTDELRAIDNVNSRPVEDESTSKDDNEESIASKSGMSMARQSWGESIVPMAFLDSVKDQVDYSVLNSTDTNDFVSNAAETASARDSSMSPAMPSQLPPPPPPTRAPPPAPIVIPSIAIHPPTSVPSSPGEAVLPPAYKNASSQTDFHPAPEMRSISMQTESIRLDKRLAMLPPHLQPSAILAPPASPPERIGVRTGKDLSPVPEDSPESSARKAKRQALARETSPTPPLSAGLTYDDVFFENDAEDPMGEGLRYPRLGKPFKPYVRSSGSNVFDYDYFDELGELDLSDNEYESFMANGKLTRRISKHRMPPSVPEDQIVGFRSSLHRSRGSAGSRGSFDRSTVRSNKSYGYAVPNRPTDNRRAVLSQKTGYTDAQLSRSPSIGSVASSSNISKSSGPAPPFAIPIRKSSATATSGNKSEASGSPTTRGGPSIRTPRRSKRSYNDKHYVRKSFSTTSLRDEAEISRKSKEFSLTAVPSSGGIPPMPKLDLSMYQTARDIASSTSRYQQFTAIAPTANATVDTSTQHSVVEAIATSMVGEWMWKYVRKRTSFGISDSNHDFTKSGDARHKRWVWLSPYEKTVMWSSKQPSSNTALMGTKGRKFVVQSVLDIKDDSPKPKAASTEDFFDRSILILTPTRALKFTATSREKHYVWLTALSFLAHNTSSIPDVAFLPPATPGGAPAPQIWRSDLPRSSPNTSGRASLAPSLKRSGAIRDTFRLPRDRATAARPATAQAQPGQQPIRPGSAYNSPISNQGVPQAAARISDAALPPNIPRLYGPRGRKTINPILTMHNDQPVPAKGPRLRKRSSTNPKARAAMHNSDAPPGTSGAKSHVTSNSSSRYSTANPTASHSTVDVRPGGIIVNGLPSGSATAQSPSLPSPINVSSGVPASQLDFPSTRSPVLPNVGALPPGPDAYTTGDASAPAASGAITATAAAPKAATGDNVSESLPRSSDLSAAFGGNYNFFDAVAHSAAASPALAGAAGMALGGGPGSVKGVNGAVITGGPLGTLPPGLAMMQHGMVNAGSSGSAMAVAGGR